MTTQQSTEPFGTVRTLAHQARPHKIFGPSKTPADNLDESDAVAFQKIGQSRLSIDFADQVLKAAQALRVALSVALQFAFGQEMSFY